MVAMSATMAAAVMTAMMPSVRGLGGFCGAVRYGLCFAQQWTECEKSQDQDQQSFFHKATNTFYFLWN